MKGLLSIVQYVVKNSNNMENKSLFESKYFYIGQHSWINVLPTIIWFDIKQPVFAFEFLFWSITFDFYNKNKN